MTSQLILQVDDVIRYMGFERSYFSKVFSKSCGLSIKDYLNDLRFSIAEQLLLETNASIKNIARCLGAEDSRALNRLFKQRTGKTPLQFRKQS